MNLGQVMNLLFEDGELMYISAGAGNLFRFVFSSLCLYLLYHLFANYSYFSDPKTLMIHTLDLEESWVLTNQKYMTEAQEDDQWVGSSAGWRDS